MFCPVCQVAAPGAKSAASDCICFTQRSLLGFSPHRGNHITPMNVEFGMEK